MAINPLDPRNVLKNIQQLDPMGGKIPGTNINALDPLNLFGTDSMNKTGGTASVPGAPAMPGGDIDELLAKLNNGKKNQFDVESASNVTSNMGKDGVQSSGSSDGGAAGGAGGQILQQIMGMLGGIVKSLLGSILGGGGGGGILGGL